MATAAKKTTASKTTGTSVEPEKAAEAEKAVSPTEEAGVEGNEAAAADAAAATDAKAAADAEAGADPKPDEGDGLGDGEGDEDDEDDEPEPEDDGVDSFDEEQPLDSAQLAAVRASAERSQMTSQTQAREYSEGLVSEKPDIRSHSAAAVARRDKEAMDALLTSGATTPAHVIPVNTGSDGKANGTGPGGTLAPVDRSGLHSPSQDALNPAFAIRAE